MVIPIILGAGGAVVSHLATKAAKDKEAEEKIELVAEMIQCTPEQAAAVNRVKGMGIDEMRMRVRTGLGPMKPLPAAAAERAREARQAAVTRQDIDRLPKEKQDEIIKSVSRVSAEEKAWIASQPDKRRAIRELVDRKVAEAGAVAATVAPEGPPPPPPSGPVEMTGEAPPPGTSERIITQYANGAPQNGDRYAGAQYEDFERGGGYTF